MKYNLGDIVEVEKKTINPQKTPNDHYCVYSLPGFDNGKTPEQLTGSKILSNKIIIDRENYILFNKLNLKFKRVWRFKNDGGNNVCSTEFLPLYTINNDKVDLDYLYYSLINDGFYARLVGQNSGTSNSHQRIHKEDLLSMEIDLPDLEVQQKIVRALSVLDQKIELNDRQNNTLFDSVRAIFRNKYYQKGNDCSLSDYILTEINGDWGKDEKEENTEKAYCIRGADIPDMEYGNKGNAPSRYILEKRLEKKSLSEDDIIIEISGGSPTQSTGRTAYITQKILDMYDAPLLCTNFCKAIKVKNKIFAPFIYMYLKSLYEDGVLFNWENGTTGIKNLALSSLLSNTKVQSLNDKEARRFYDQFYAIVNKISKNSAENMILIQMRDTLLPKLMSGEINPEGIKE